MLNLTNKSCSDQNLREQDFLNHGRCTRGWSMCHGFLFHVDRGSHKKPINFFIIVITWNKKPWHINCFVWLAPQAGSVHAVRGRGPPGARAVLSYCRYCRYSRYERERERHRLRRWRQGVFSFLTQQQQHQTIDSRLVDSPSHVLLPLRVAVLALNYQRSTWKVVSLSFARPPQVHFFTIANLDFARDTAIRCM